MALTPGTRIGSYEVTAQVGVGGMGEVYRATDTKLKRDVAIKVLPESVAADPERLARFQREAEVLASLNHPNIAHLNGLEESDGTKALVMELVDGPTLADRLAQGPIPVEEALAIAKQIADALEAAHEQGIVHRDLKPANVKVRDDGTVKVLDFGLAKALEGPGGSGGPGGLTQSPTITTPAMTQAGLILGTAAYMSPEQARGRPADQRADIWAFGVLLYEMVTGRRMFEGDDVTVTLAAVVMKEPDLDAVPRRLRRLVGRCVTKNPRARLRHIGDAWELLDDPPPEKGAPAAAPRQLPLMAAIGVAAVAVGVLAGRASVSSPGADAPAATMHVSVALEAGQRLSGGLSLGLENTIGRQRPSVTSFALSPDGTRLVYVGTDGETTRLFDRPLDRARATPLAGTEGAANPLFSPDGRSVAFGAGGQVRRVDLATGEIRTVALADPATPGGRGNATGRLTGVSWADDDRFIVSAERSIFSVPSSGGRPAMLAALEDPSGQQGVAVSASLLPGGRALLLNLARDRVPSEWDIVVQPLQGGERRVVVAGGSDPRYLPTGHLAFMRRGALMAVPFDLDRLQATGDPVVVVEDVMHADGSANSLFNTGIGQFSVSRSGRLAYVPGGVFPGMEVRLTLIDRTGAETPVSLPPGPYVSPRLAPDGRRLAYASGGFGDRQIWVYDLVLGVPTRMTSEGENTTPVWSADGRQLAYAKRAGAEPGLYVTAADGSGQPRRLVDDVRDVASWSRDGVLAFLRGGDIWTVDVAGGGQPAPFRQTPATEDAPVFSADGAWLAYVSNEAGGPDLYVRPFPAGEPAHRLSTGGAEQPVWSPDGRQLFWTRLAGEQRRQLWGIEVDPAAPGFARGQPRLLFEKEGLGATRPIGSLDISPDGLRFVGPMAVPAEPQPVTQIQLVDHWFEELARLVPTN